MEKILIVEDDRKIAELERDYLESNGYETAILADGSQVIPELETNSYDLVLLDVMLPGCSGYEICRRIRDEIDIPILMVTARTEAVDVIRGLGLGADGLYYQTLRPLPAGGKGAFPSEAVCPPDRRKTCGGWGRIRKDHGWRCGDRAKDLESVEKRQRAEAPQQGV